MALTKYGVAPDSLTKEAQDAEAQQPSSESVGASDKKPAKSGDNKKDNPAS